MSRRLRIGIDGSLASSKRPTGVEHFARSLLAELLRLDLPDIEWFLYLPPYATIGSEVPRHVNARYRPDVNTLIKKPWLIGNTWRDRLDVMYAFGHLLTPGCRGRAVLTVHDLAFDEYPDCYPPGAAETAHAQVVASCKQAHCFAVPSEATKAGLIAGYGYPAERIHVIYEGSRPVFTPGPAGPLPQKVVEAGVTSPYFLSVGRLDRRKNVERVIDAYRGLVRAGSGCGGLVIVGPDDSGSEAVRARVAAGKVEGERIVMTGYLDDAEMITLFRGAAAVVYPSLAEGFGLPVLEAMACGVPTITSCVSSMLEVGREAALLVDPMDTAAIETAMQRILTEEGLRERLTAAGLARAAELTWSGSAERLVDVLRRAAG